MILQFKQIIPQDLMEQDHRDSLISYIAEKGEQNIASELIKKISDHKFYMIHLSEPYIEIVPDQNAEAYRQHLDCIETTICDKCKYNPYKPRRYSNNDIVQCYEWCRHIAGESNGRGFCSWGKHFEEDTKTDPYLKKRYYIGGEW